MIINSPRFPSSRCRASQRPIVTIRLLAALSLVGLLLPFVPVEVFELVEVLHDPHELLAMGITGGSAWLLAHRVVFVFNRKLPHGNPGLAELTGAGMVLIVSQALAVDQHVVPELMLSATSVFMAILLSVVSELIDRGQRHVWLSKTALPDICSLLVLLWAMCAYEAMRTTADTGPLIYVVAGVHGLHVLNYLVELPELIED